MAKAATKKIKAIEPQCAYCLNEVIEIGVSGSTCADKTETLIPFKICKVCYHKMHAGGSAANIALHKKKFWDKVYTNVKKMSAVS